ncbi:MAG: N-acetylmuramoyl-L-alanine amidase [Bacteroidetes bacterium]|nr:N-acetylmuramoyl-L-alanine amidase [Bacteroidota bacterium]MBL7103953.1 N-acetylmuramoyl-L-alanine amidase [Bacteroidales bacterium]
MKRLVLNFGIILLLCLIGLSGFSQLENKITKVVIDAGHGGKDPGALGKHSKEKDIVLAVALKTGKYIEENFKYIEVLYTRKTDVFVELHKRAQIANESGADVFISIHCNSNRSSQPYGAETYVMGLHKTQQNLEVAKTENAAILYEDDYITQYEGFDPNSDEDYIILSMFQSANIDQSINLSSKVQNQFHERVGRKDRGVKQAGFWVLYKTTMPGILIELGFLSNPNEEKFLISDKGQVYMASAIYRAFKEYKKEFEEANKNLKPVVVKKEESKPVIYYRVQFASFKKEKSLDFRKFRGLQEIKMYKHDGSYKYTTGNETSLKNAIELKEKLRDKGYKDIFVVAFLNEERISLDEANRLNENKN